MPTHVAQQQQMSHFGPLTQLFDDAVRAYVCGAKAAAFAMCRALLETVLNQSYLSGEFTEKDQLGRERNIPLSWLLARAGQRYRFVPIPELSGLVRIANKILHGSPALYDERAIPISSKSSKF